MSNISNVKLLLHKCDCLNGGTHKYTRVKYTCFLLIRAIFIENIGKDEAKLPRPTFLHACVKTNRTNGSQVFVSHLNGWWRCASARPRLQILPRSVSTSNEISCLYAFSGDYRSSSMGQRRMLADVFKCSRPFMRDWYYCVFSKPYVK